MYSSCGSEAGGAAAGGAAAAAAGGVAAVAVAAALAVALALGFGSALALALALAWAGSATAGASEPELDAPGSPSADSPTISTTLSPSSTPCKVVSESCPRLSSISKTGSCAAASRSHSSRLKWHCGHRRADAGTPFAAAYDPTQQSWKVWPQSIEYSKSCRKEFKHDDGEPHIDDIADVRSHSIMNHYSGDPLAIIVTVYNQSYIDSGSGHPLSFNNKS
jgi:hypothetical protein